MTHAVPVRFNDSQLQALDRLVAEGVGETRSAVIRNAVDRLAESTERDRLGQMIADSYRRQPQSAEDGEMALANGIAMVEAEPW
ncbi:MAG: ribbon-helix-helix domain-containing protein [bacterium]|nr:ribbon-helix-helix domain-containing protein [bacterium]MCY3924860.1 ribbon-helix-helix domain-containing protein [bacterium]